MQIAVIVGARPQFIKLAPLARALERKHRVTIIHTGQHYNYGMSQSFFSQLRIPAPDVNLGVGSGPQGRQTGRMMIAVEATLRARKPDLALVFGDTNSTLAGALAARKLNIPVGHVEAGLRSFNRRMPEEINRLLADRVSDLLFCPTPTAVTNLRAEGIGIKARAGVPDSSVGADLLGSARLPGEINCRGPGKVRGCERLSPSECFSVPSPKVFLTGDVMLDALIFFRPLAARKSKILGRVKSGSQEYLLLTIHRAENTDDPGHLKRIITALASTGEPVVFPIHPRTKKALRRYRVPVGGEIRVIDPVGYLEMLFLEMNAARILTDSGGVQKEAYMLGVPCVTLRNETEWVETAHNGWNIVAGTEEDGILRALGRPFPSRPRRAVFGDGHAAEKIAEIIDGL